MKTLIRKYLIISAAVYIVVQLIPALSITGGLANFMYATAVLSLLYLIAKPIINIFLFPIHLLTLSITAWLVNIMLIFVWKLLVPSLAIGDWTFETLSLGFVTLSSVHFPPWQVMVIIGFLLTFIIQLLDWLVK